VTAALLLVAALAEAQAADMQPHPELPLRPITYPVDPGLTGGAVENFRRLDVDPAAVASRISPSGPPAVPGGLTGSTPGKASLPIVNESSSWAEVTVGDLKIGIIGPYTAGAIHNVQPGTYKVSFLIQNGFRSTKEVSTTTITRAIIPGGEGARISIDEKQGGVWPLWATVDPNKGWTKAAPPPPPAPPVIPSAPVEQTPPSVPTAPAGPPRLETAPPAPAPNVPSSGQK
jgi:hypothetical protein